MHFFNYKGNRLYAEDLSVEEIAEEVRTPLYIYSHSTLVRHYHAFDRAFEEVPHLVCYSAKANSNVTILRTLIKEGSGVDIVSGGELFRALKAGVKPGKVVYSGVGKTMEEIEFAISTGILMFNVESPEELRLIDKVAGRLEKRAAVAIRVNPDVDPKTHPYISTGLKKNKFGMVKDLALKEYAYAKRYLKHLDLVGVDCHIGSQITQISPFIDALRKVKELVLTLREDGIDIQYLDMGGGLGITYKKELPPNPSKYGKAVIKETKDLDVTLVFEPGRVIMGNAGILVTRVLYVKENAGKRFIIVDAAMNDLARPSLYSSYHAIKPVKKSRRGSDELVDVVGPICESGDFFAQDRELPPIRSGDLLAVMSAGAYGFAMSSNYNARPRVPEVIVKGNDHFLIRERENYKDLLRREKMIRL